MAILAGISRLTALISWPVISSSSHCFPTLYTGLKVLSFFSDSSCYFHNSHTKDWLGGSEINEVLLQLRDGELNNGAQPENGNVNLSYKLYTLSREMTVCGVWIEIVEMGC